MKTPTEVTLEKGLQRILRIADKVETVKPKRFYFGQFVGDDWKGGQELDCGTTACAYGWAATIPYFRRLGLSLYKGDVYAKGISHKRGLDADPKYSKQARVLFGMDKNTWDSFFIPRFSYPWEQPSGRAINHGFPRLAKNATPEQWARHARDLVKGIRSGKYPKSITVETKE